MRLGRLPPGRRWNNVGGGSRGLVADLPDSCSRFLDGFALRTWGSEMEATDKVVSLFGSLLFVAMAVAVIEAAIGAFGLGTG